MVCSVPFHTIPRTVSAKAKMRILISHLQFKCLINPVLTLSIYLVIFLAIARPTVGATNSNRDTTVGDAGGTEAVGLFEETTVLPKSTRLTKSSRSSSRKRASRDELDTSEPKAGKLNTIKPSSWLAVANSMAEVNGGGPAGGGVQLDESRPTKYHYYPHNQHLYLLPECATQQVCSAVYLRLNYSQPLCACPSFHKPCSVSTRTDDRHTIPLVTGQNSQVLTLVKTCEPTGEVRECRAPKDWSILALQNSRTGKAHYLVICRCPSPGYLEGPIAHSQPAYARVPGIRVYGMTCRLPNSSPIRTGRLDELLKSQKSIPSTTPALPSTTSTTTVTPPEPDNSRGGSFPWRRIKTLLKDAGILPTFTS